MLMEDYPSAVQTFSDLIQKWGGQLGEDHPNVLKAVNNLGRVYLRQENMKLPLIYLYSSNSEKGKIWRTSHRHYSISYRLWESLSFAKKVKPAEEELLLALQLSESLLAQASLCF